jgi:hypothetical protein
MHKHFFAISWSLCICLTVSAQAQLNESEKKLVGDWAGSWSGGGSGSFVMTITKDATGKLSGNITPKSENGDSWTAPFESVTLADGKVILKVPDPGGEVDIIIEATVDESILRGEYSLRTKVDGSQRERGTIKANKKR